jgi:hypothetical protein
MAIVVPIVTEYNGKGLNSAVKEIGKAEGALGKLSAAGKIVGSTMAAAGVAFVAFKGAQFLNDTVKSASDLSEALNKNKVIFGEYARTIEDFSKNAGTALGQTQTQALNAASTFATFGKAAGVTGTELTEFSTKLTTLASDLGSFWNVDTEQAITAIGAALRNETEPIRRFGVLINQASLEQKAFDMGLTSSVQTLTQQQRVLAAYGSILEQTTDAQGDFARTQDGLANTTKTLAAAFENAKASIGEGFVQAINNATSSLGGAQGLGGAIENAGAGVGDFVSGLGVLVDKLAEVSDGISQLAGSATDAEDGQSLLSGATDLYLKQLDILIPGLVTLTSEISGLGAAYTQTAEDANALYDSTVALAKAQRFAAYERQQLGKNLAATAVDPSLDRLKAQDWNTRLEAVGFGAAKAAKELDKLNKSSGGASSGVSKLAGESKAAQEKFDELSLKVKASATRLDTATASLQAAKDAFSDYSGGKAAGIMGQVSIADAINQQIEQTMKLGALDRAITDAWGAGEWENLAGLLAQRSGEAAAVNWVDGFEQQIASSKSAQVSIDKLLATLNPADTVGNKALLDSLTQLSPAQAQMAADDLVNRQLGTKIAAELSSLDLFAGAAGDRWASMFYSEGVDAAQSQVDGITARLNEKLDDLYRQGRKMGKAVKDGYNSVVDSLPNSAKNAIRNDMLGDANGPVTIHINTAVGDPVAIARTINRTLKTASQRTGR